MDEACKSNDMGATPYSGARVSNTWVIYLLPWNNGWKRPLIPNEVALGIRGHQRGGSQDLVVKEEPMGYQLVGGVTAHQG